MKKILIAVLFVSSVCLAQNPALDLYGVRLNEGRPFFTYDGIYNSYDLSNSPLGVFETDSASLSVEAGYKMFSLDNEKGHYLTLPAIRIGESRRAFFQAFYKPAILSYETSADNMRLPLNRFGLALAAQSRSGLFQLSIMSSGYIGTQKWKDGDSTRALLGLENLRLDFGSRVHEIARIGVFAGAALNVDTLSSDRDEAAGQQPRADRSAHVILPLLGAFVDFGNENFPARSNLSFQYASGRFVYVSKDDVNRVGVDGLGNEFSVINDSLQILWMTAGRVPIGEHLLKPGLLLGYSINAGKLRWPDEDSSPLKMKDAVQGGFFDLSEVYFGVGTGFEALSYADMFIEYVYNSAAVNYGDHFSQDFSEEFPNNFPKSVGLHSFSLGASTSPHKYCSMPFSLTPRIAYFISQSAGVIKARRMNTEPLNPVVGKSKEYIYKPYLYLDNKETTSGFTVGLDGQSPDTKYSGSLYTTFLNRKMDGGYSESGIEMGFVFTFAIPAASPFDN